MATDITIENPVINSPYDEPSQHFRFTDDGITDEVVEKRRVSAYFVPVPPPKKKGKTKQPELWTKDRIENNEFINQVRQRVGAWRDGNYPGVTKTTTRLLEHWTRPERDKRLFFCQREAVETIIYIAEAARKFGDQWITNDLRDANKTANHDLFRIASKMATGSGKTIVMAMLIAWHTLNKLANRQDRRFSDSFLIVTPGITIRDRLRVLLPSDPANYYKEWDLVPPHRLSDLNRAQVVITNFHAFLRHETMPGSKLGKQVLTKGKANPTRETPAEMVRRVCRDLGNKKNIVVINDEAHHCYRGKKSEEKLKGDERREAKAREEQARVWITGLEAVKKKLGIKAVYDLSATPFFLRGSGYSEGTLFPWVVSDFSLIDAIECGIVKVPRVPVEDNTMTGEQPTYRDLWGRVRNKLPKRGRKTRKVTGEPELPAELEAALESLYGNYVKHFEAWQEALEDKEQNYTPPVFIVVCNNTNVSKLVFDHIAGWEKEIGEDETVVVPGALPLFSNEENGQWRSRPYTVLIDSSELESGESMSRKFKKAAAAEIEEFKDEYRARFPGRDVDQLDDEDLLREVMNTVGKAGKLGEHVRCVVSVSMLTEGWDANTVTHILGVRAFGTQLLCEQVIGRGLRRRSYQLNDDDKFNPEYAEVYGVPFSFIPCAGSGGEVKPGPAPTRVSALDERADCEITFPRVTGYRYDLSGETLQVEFTEESEMVLSTEDLPTKVTNAPIVGEQTVHTLDDLKARREQEVAFLLAKLLLEKYFRAEQNHDDDDEPEGEHHFRSDVKAWLFPQVLDITRRWLDECVRCKDNTFKQLLLLIEHAHNATDRIYRAIVRSDEGDKVLMPILAPYNTLGSTEHVDFNTTRPVYPTDERFCHVSHVVADTDTWEQKVTQAIEELGDDGLVVSYVKNQNLGFTIPYIVDGNERNYYPDFILRIDDGHGPDHLLNFVVEVSGREIKDKTAKVATATTLWVPAINHHGGFGRWAFLEVRDPWDAKNAIRESLAASTEDARA